MPRQPRIEFPGAIYHVMSLGDRGEDIFLDDIDRYDFLKTLAETCGKTSWQVHAWCLMRNHFHLVLETPEPSLVEGMRWLQSTYAIRLNHRHKLFGHLFSGRYKALLVEGGHEYFKTVCDYVHLNPVRARLLPPESPLVSYPWTSLPWYAVTREHRPPWIQVARLLGAHGLRDKDSESLAEFQRRLEARRQAEEDEQNLAQIRRGWCFGRTYSGKNSSTNLANARPNSKPANSASIMAGLARTESSSGTRRAGVERERSDRPPQERPRQTCPRRAPPAENHSHHPANRRASQHWNTQKRCHHAPSLDAQ
jgi:REP element-mobilizing transposase RayT